METSVQTVFVVDDDPSICQSVGRVARGRGLRVETFTSPEAFLERIEPLDCGCLVLDLRMPETPGEVVHAELLARDINLPVIYFTGFGTVPVATEAMRRGATHFLSKPLDPTSLLHAVNHALELDRDRCRQRRARMMLREKYDSLTPREAEVFRRVAAGDTTRQIARRFSRSEKTVSLHRTRVTRKLGAKSVAHLVQIAIQLGIDPEDPDG